MLKRLTMFLYGLGCHAVFLGTHLYAIGFVARLFVSRSVDAPRPGEFVGSLIVDLALLLGFALQHAVMARQGIRRWVMRFVSEPAERNTYLIATSRALIALFAFWRPLGGTVWSVEEPAATAALYGLCAFGLLLLIVCTALIKRFTLFGPRQPRLHPISTAPRPADFRTSGPYRLVRHPLYLGCLVAFWSTPTMTAAHLLFALIVTVYILFAIRLEERDLVASLGDAYREYRQRVPMLIPFARARGGRSLRIDRCP